MNWLAHILLSELNINFQIGNYLADPLKGRVWDEANIDIKKGMELHKLIDSYTDNHSIFIQSKKRLGDKGLLKSVVIDLTYDYLLTKNWDIFCSIPIDIFLQNFYIQANQQLQYLPHEVGFHLQKLIKYDILNKYRDLEQLKKSFIRVDKRLSSRLLKRDQASSYFERVSYHIKDIEDDFLIFFPELCEMVQVRVENTKLVHLKY